MAFISISENCVEHRRIHGLTFHGKATASSSRSTVYTGLRTRTVEKCSLKWWIMSLCWQSNRRGFFWQLPRRIVTWLHFVKCKVEYRGVMVWGFFKEGGSNKHSTPGHFDNLGIDTSCSTLTEQQCTTHNPETHGCANFVSKNMTDLHSDVHESWVQQKTPVWGCEPDLLIEHQNIWPQKCTPTQFLKE